MKPIAALLLALSLLLAPSLQAKVVRPAPDLLFASGNGKASSLKSLKGQPVVILFGASPRQGAVRKQVKYLEDLYRLLAGRQAIFIYAVQNDAAGGIKSDIPFVPAQNPAAVASAYGVAPGKFALAVVGTDGNLDLITSKVSPGERVMEIFNNSYPAQVSQRKD